MKILSLNHRFLAFILALIMTLTTTELSFAAGNGLSPDYTLTLIAIEGGTVTGGGDYAEGEIVNITAEPNNGYIFVCWCLEDGTFENQEYAETTFTMPADDVTITAIFQDMDTFAGLAAEIENMLLINNGELPDMYITKNDYVPGFIDGMYSDVVVTDYDSAIDSLYDIKELMLFDDPSEQFEGASIMENEFSYYYRLQQLYEGLRVYGNQLIVTTDLSGNIRTLSGSYDVIYDMPVTPIIDCASAALTVEADYGEVITDGELLILLTEDAQELAWCFETRDCLVFVSAVDGVGGRILKSDSLFHR